MIPKVIHQSYKTVWHPYRRCWQQSWIENHPAWVYCFYTDEDNCRIVRQHFPQFLAAYTSFPQGIMKADFCRFLYLYLWGGIYVDLDYVCLRAFDTLFDQIKNLGIPELPSNEYYRYHNALLISEARNRFWLKCAEEAIHYFNSANPPKVEWLAGPFRLQSVIKSTGTAFTPLQTNHVTPIDWYSYVHWGRADRDSAALRKRLRESQIQVIQSFFPEAYALTFWDHRW